MAGKTVVAGSTVSASQLKDFFRQIDDGSINGQIMQAILEHRNPCENRAEKVLDFFRTNPKLDVSNYFLNHMTSVVSGCPVARGIKVFVLPKDMWDKDVVLKLGDGCVWNAGDLLLSLSILFTEQEDGKSGRLLNNGRNNLFYIDSGVVVVQWRADYWMWKVHLDKREAQRWHLETQVLSPVVWSAAILK